MTNASCACWIFIILFSFLLKSWQVWNCLEITQCNLHDATSTITINLCGQELLFLPQGFRNLGLGGKEHLRGEHRRWTDEWCLQWQPGPASWAKPDQWIRNKVTQQKNTEPQKQLLWNVFPCLGMSFPPNLAWRCSHTTGYGISWSYCNPSLKKYIRSRRKKQK